MKVVVFDDSCLVRECLHSWLTREGHEVSSFSSPEHFKACTCGKSRSGQCSKACADVILSDIKMPRANGLDFMAELEDSGCRVPRRALMSGYWTNAYLKKARALAIKVFHKPFSLREVQEWLDAPTDNA